MKANIRCRMHGRWWTMMRGKSCFISKLLEVKRLRNRLLKLVNLTEIQKPDSSLKKLSLHGG